VAGVVVADEVAVWLDALDPELAAVYARWYAVRGRLARYVECRAAGGPLNSAEVAGLDQLVAGLDEMAAVLAEVRG
jgi:hypothetical protein